MICPQCRRSFYFLEGLGKTETAVCKKCGYRGAPREPDYSAYHEERYLAKNYKRNLQTDPQMRRILSAVKIWPGDTLIDLGCGVGDYTKAISLFTANAAGYDRDVQAARKKYPGLSFFKMDFGKPLPLADASVDKIISINVIEHLKDPEFFLRECQRVLKPGGLIALSTANRNFLLHDLHYDPTHFYEWTLGEFDSLLRPYFTKISLAKDCAMFKFYPLNLLLRFLMKPDLTYIGRK